MSLDGYVDDYEELPQGPNGKKQKGGGFFGSKEPVKGRKWDHVRNGDPVIVRASPEAASPWHAFAQSTIYAPYPNEDVKKVDEAFLLNQTPGYDRPWKGDLDGVNDPEKLSGIFHSQKQRRTFIRRVQVSNLKHMIMVSTDNFLAHSSYASSGATRLPSCRSLHFYHRACHRSFCSPPF